MAIKDKARARRRTKPNRALQETPPFQFSGRYEYNGGASLRAGRESIDSRSGRSRAALKNPMYRLEEPVYLDDPEPIPGRRSAKNAVRITLHIDVDGHSPLNVVSGTVALGPETPGAAFPFFVGRVISNQDEQGGHTLVVQDFRFAWPDSVNQVDRLEIELRGNALTTPPIAKATFIDTQQSKRFGPFSARQQSIFFREVEVEVDRESGAVDPEPYDTHAHPDRPSALPAERLTLEAEFAKAGVRLTRTVDAGEPIETLEAGDDRQWTYGELHDSMERHWQAFANRPQWKMWIFLANRATDDSLGGVMFDGEIDEPGGVDRQGTAVFTQCPLFHTPNGDYCVANPPADAAARRELFFDLMHETGHAFNLAHSFQKTMGTPWAAPEWLTLATDAKAMSWMNYPDSASEGVGARFNATWFYRRFAFRFDDSELLFLRHAPESYVQMGSAAWFENHARVARINLDNRLQLALRARRGIVDLGEPVMLEIKLANVSGEAVAVHKNLDPSDGLVELAITNPNGERRPLLPFDHTRRGVRLEMLESGKAVYHSVDISMGAFGFVFKQPGPYRVEASYVNLDGTSAAAVLQLYVRPPAQSDDTPVINEMFNARVGRVMYLEGTRMMNDVNDKLDWILSKLGPRHPLCHHLRAIRYLPLARDWNVVEETDTLAMFGAEPDVLTHQLGPVMVDGAADVADTMGHIWYHQVVDTFCDAAVLAGKRQQAVSAKRSMLELFQARGVVEPVVRAVAAELRQLTSSAPRKKKARRAGV